MTLDIALFVYGSLKAGFRHADVLSGARRAGQAAAAPYTLVRYGSYPAMAPASSGVVHGEIAFIDQRMLTLVDEFDDCPTSYQRHTIRLLDGRAAEAYLISAEVARAYAVVPGGIWREA